jgi:hypothetical protein
VARQVMAEFMRDHGGEFRVVPHRLHHPAGHAHQVAAGGEGIDLRPALQPDAEGAGVLDIGAAHRL